MVGRPRQLGPQGIEPRSVVPETTVLSVELQARVRSRLLLGRSRRLDSVRGGLCLRTGRLQSRFYRGGIKAGMESCVFPASSQEGGGFERGKAWTEDFQEASLVV